MTSIKTWKISAAALLFVACEGAVSTTSPNDESNLDVDTTTTFEVQQANGPSVSQPLRNLPDHGWSKWDPDMYEKHSARPLPDTNADAPDTVIQGAADPAAPSVGSVFEGIYIGETTGLSWIPPDTVGAVGPNHYVQAVNDGLGVFDKSTGAMLKLVPVNALWAGFGGGCEANNDGDPTVNYDVLADRWIVAQFSVSTTPYLQCVAVSASGDPMGSYYRYSFEHSEFPDYPKLSVWPDAYYETFNMFTSRFVGGKVCAYDRAAMLAGSAATEQCFHLSSSYGGLLVSHTTSAAHAPAAGTPAYVLNLSSSALNEWRFHVDFASSANTTFTGPTSIAVAGFTRPKKGPQQPDTRQRLDTLADRLMYRLAYRNFGDHESLVVNHSVAVGQGLGVRWYELRGNGASLAVYQQGTYAPDGTSRWMGSAAMDKMGNIALGYSASSSTVYPSIRYSGRLATDPLGTLQAETIMRVGTGSQTNANRWGDYSSMSVDPTDDCTLFYTNEYLPVTSARGWHTSIGFFKFPNCQ